MPEAKVDQPEAPNNHNTEPYVFETPDWEFWRQRNGCRLWKSVLLSMNIEPVDDVRALLEEHAPQKYAQYKRRLDVILGAHGVSKCLPRVQHPRAGNKPSEQWMVLTDLLAFAKESNWKDVAPFEYGLTNQPSSSDIEEQLNVPSVDFDDLQKGERYTVLRFGALLKLVESLLTNDKKFDRNQFVKSGSLNYSALGKAIESVLSDQSNKSGGTALPNCKAQVNSKRISEAIKAVDAL